MILKKTGKMYEPVHTRAFRFYMRTNIAPKALVWADNLTKKETAMSYTYNKMPKVAEITKAFRRAITKDIREHGLTWDDFANQIGLSRGTLENKLKPASPYDLTLTEAIHIIDITGDYGPLEEIARRYGFILCGEDGATRPRCDGDVVMSVTIGALDLGAVFGDLEKIVSEAVKDGQIDENEADAIEKVAYEIRKLAKQLEEIAKERKKEG